MRTVPSRPGIQAFLDWAIALGLAALGQYELWVSKVESHFQGPRPLDALFLLLISLPLAWRRRAPLAVLALVLASTVVWLHLLYDFSRQPPFEPFIALLVVIYSVAAHAERRHALIGAAIAAIGIVAIEVPGVLSGRSPEEVIPSIVLFSIAWGLGRLLHKRHRHATALERQARQLEEEREEKAREAVAEERSRIARELHDVVAHSLSVIVVQAAAERRVLNEDPQSTRHVLASIESTGREALAELRRLLGVIRKSGDTLTLEPQPTLQHVDSLIAKVRQAGVSVELRIEGEQESLPPGVGLSAYRILQEALTNVLKHAGASRAEVMIRHHRGEVEVEVTDDGASESIPSTNGHGLIGMQERVAMFGGVCEAGSREGGGYRVYASLPFERSIS